MDDFTFARRQKPKYRSWLLETLSLVTALAFAIALVVLLRRFDGKDVHSWKYPVTANALVSLISLAFRACVLYIACECISQWKWILFNQKPHLLIDFERMDWASRGPLGSAWMLMSTLRRTRLVGIGAVLVILALALDPFAQQIIRSDESMIFQTDLDWPREAQIHYTEGYDAGKYFLRNRTYNDDGTHTMVWDTTTSIDMQSAILFGLSHTVGEVQRQMAWKCPTVDCKWAPYESLAVCSECVNTTDMIHRVKGNSTALAEGYPGLTGTWKWNHSATAFRLPNGQFIINFDGRFAYGNNTASAGGSPALRMTASGTGLSNDTLALKHRHALIWATNVISLLPGPDGYDGKWPGVPMASQECGLYWCKKLFKSVLSNNTYSEEEEELNSTIHWKINNGEQLPDTRIDFVEVIRNDADYLSAIPDVGLCPQDVAPNGTAEVPGYYYVRAEAALSTNHHFHKTFASDVTPENKTAGLGPDQLHNEAHVLQYEMAPSMFNALWKWDDPDLEPGFTALARSMTNVVRMTGKRTLFSRDQDVAEIGRTVSLYRIEWVWMTLHGAVALLTTIFLALTVWHSRESATPALKSSALAVLKRGQYLCDVLGDVETEKGCA